MFLVYFLESRLSAYCHSLIAFLLTGLRFSLKSFSLEYKSSRPDDDVDNDNSDDDDHDDDDDDGDDDGDHDDGK
jgi:hypothetical protein